MLAPSPHTPIDYMVIGHLTRDLTPSGPRMGGTAAYSGLTARALGMKVGVITSCANDFDRSLLNGIPMINKPTEQSTTFENVYTQHGRVQFTTYQSPMLDYSLVPEIWKNSPIVHLGPIAQEVDPNLSRCFPNSLLVVTPQGFLRTWDIAGKVSPCDWPEFRYVLGYSEIAILSVEDVQADEERIEELASAAKILVVTDGPGGCRVFWNGDVRRFVPPEWDEVDATGAGDIFATSYFFRYMNTRDPWESARFATQLAAHSVLRLGMQGVPTREEINSCLLEVL